MVFNGLLAIIVGLFMIPSLDLTSWIPSIYGMVVGFIGLTMVSLKRFTSISSIQKLGVAQWTTVIISTGVLIVSFLMSPLFGISTGVFGAISGVVVMLGGLPLILEAIVR